MLKHEQIWSAIDALASRHSLSASGLAKSAGLDPTTFNKSKRLTTDGKQRWPSTESIAKILLATDETLESFVASIAQSGAQGEKRLPLIGSRDAMRPGSFSESGAPAGALWEDIRLGGISDVRAFAIEVESGDLTNLYGEGAILIVAPNATLRRGDRIVACLRSGGIVIGEARREPAEAIEIVGVGPAGESRTLRMSDVAWIGRIHWASQ